MQPNFGTLKLPFTLRHLVVKILIYIYQLFLSALLYDFLSSGANNGIWTQMFKLGMMSLVFNRHAIAAANFETLPTIRYLWQLKTLRQSYSCKDV
jgi:hypothetical protein